MESLNIVFGALDGVFQRVGNLQRGTFELRLRDKKAVWAATIDFRGDGTEGVVTTGFDTLENGAYTRFNEAVVEHSTLAELWPRGRGGV